MADIPTPRPLTAQEVAETKAAWQGVRCEVVDADVVLSLVATVEQLQAEVDRLTANLATTTSQRDAADALPDADAILTWIFENGHEVASVAYPTDQTYRVIVEGSLAAIQAMRHDALARAAQPQEGT